METKRCFHCGQDKPLDEFHLHKKGGQGRQPKCKACTSSWHKIYNARVDIKEAKAPRAREYNKQWRAENMQKARDMYAAWKTDYPVAAIGKNLRRALERRPTENPITVKQAVEIWKKQEGRCALSGVMMTWGKGAFYPTSISLDRIDSTKGYTVDNVRLLCYAVNAMKGVWDDAHVHEIAQGIVERKHQSQEPTWQPFSAFTNESDYMVVLH